MDGTPTWQGPQNRKGPGLAVREVGVSGRQEVSAWAWGRTREQGGGVWAATGSCAVLPCPASGACPLTEAGRADEGQGERGMGPEAPGLLLCRGSRAPSLPLLTQVPAGLLLPRALRVLNHQRVREELGRRALHPGEPAGGAGPDRHPPASPSAQPSLTWPGPHPVSSQCPPLPPSRSPRS